MKRASQTTWTLAALAIGLALGTLGHKTALPIFKQFGDWTKSIGTLWIAALQLIVIPLVITNVIAAVANVGAKSAGKLGLRSFVLFGCMLLASGLFAIGLTKPIVNRLPIDQQTMTTFARSASANRDSLIPSNINATSGSVTEWLSTLLPTNLLEAGSKGNIFALLLFAAAFALAITRLPAQQRDLLTKVFQGLSEAMIQLTKWLLVVTPIGVFALTYGLALQIGVSGGEMLAAYVVIASALIILFTLLLYPATALLSGSPIGTFARAVWPAQLVAATTRSSIASLPSMVQGARDRLKLPAAGTSFVLPLAVAILKVNQPISTVVKLILVAQVYGIALGPTQLFIFLVTVIFLSSTTAGIPQNGPMFRHVPAYLAAGVPLEGVIVLEAVEAIPDIFKTLLNVTADMSAATILTRSKRTDESHFAAPESSTAAESAA